VVRLSTNRATPAHFELTTPECVGFYKPLFPHFLGDGDLRCYALLDLM